MEWSRDMAKALVRLYKEKDCLWNPQNQDHYQKSKRNDAWTEIAAELTVLYDNLVSINDCKKKMDCILSSFRREKIKVKRIRVEKGMSRMLTCFSVTMEVESFVSHSMVALAYNLP